MSLTSKNSQVVTDATGKVIDLLMDRYKDDPEKRIKLYRKIAMDLIDLSYTMQCEFDAYGH